jgi:hypothetical protein
MGLVGGPGAARSAGAVYVVCSWEDRVVVGGVQVVAMDS